MNNEFNLTAVDFNPFEGGELEKTIPSIESQQEIWTSCVIGGIDANRSYNESVSLILTGIFDRNAMEKAIYEVTNRHEALRATLSSDGKSLCIYKDTPIVVDYDDLSSLATNVQEERLKDAGKKDAETSFDLQEGPLFRAFIFKLSETEHIVRLTGHHIICDGWSFGIILEDLGKLYSAYTQSQTPILEEVISFSQYAQEMETFFKSETYKETKRYWLNEYKNDVPLLDLPTDFPRPSIRTYKSKRDDFLFDQELITAVRKTGGKAGSSLVSTLMVAFEIYLHRITGQNDIVLGLPSAGQSATGHNALVGHCVNLLPLRSRPTGDLSFLEYLKIRKFKIMDDYEHQQFTFGSLLKDLNIARDSSRVPLVPVVFNIDMGMDANVSFHQLAHKLVSNPRDYENFEIFLNATGSQQSMVLEWSYNSQLFKPTTIKRMMDEFVVLLKEIVTNPDVQISSLSLNTSDTLSKIEKWNNTQVHYPKDETITQLIGKIANQYPTKTAIYFKEEQLSYKEINEQSNRLANYFIQQGVQKGDIVALLLDRSPALIISLMAIIKSGASYLPIDPEHPKDRIEFMLTDSTAKLLITDHKKITDGIVQTKVLDIEQIWGDLSSFSDQAVAVSIDGNDLAYVLYTSGSTGKPKGVLIEHHSLTNLVLSLQKSPGITAADLFLAATTISFDIAAVEIYLPLVTGASIVLAETNEIKDGRLLLELIEKHKVTIAQATPSSWRILVESGLTRAHHLKAFCGGEQFPADLAENMVQTCSSVWNMYAPTETTVYSIIKQIKTGDKSTTIGLPIDNTQVYILDNYGHPVPANTSGEICIAGDGLARGYLNQQELTAEKFTLNTFIKEDGIRVYHTGDLGRLNENNEIECLGRIDQQLKIRGFRIEPGEIEYHLTKQNGVKEAVVIAREDKIGDQRLVAYIVPDQKDGTGWQERWEDLYQLGVQNEQDLPLEEQNLDIAIISQYNTDADIREHGMEWTNEGLKRIRALKARDIMELGTGGGHLMLALAPETDTYVATDYSHVAISKLQEKLAVSPDKWKHVKAYEALADDFTGIEPASFDLVFLHGVIQYFPSLSYVLKVIEPASQAIRNGGCIYIGDPQTLSAITMHFYNDQLAITKDDVSVAEFKKISDFRIRKEEEISIDTDFFYFLPEILPEIKAVDVQIRSGDYSNEATKCHYDVWLYKGDLAPKVVDPELILVYESEKGIDGIEQSLIDNKSKIVQILHIPNIRVNRDFVLMNLVENANEHTTVKDLKEQLDQIPVQGLNPTLLWELGERMGYKTHVRWSGDGIDGNVEVVFIPLSYGHVVPSKPTQLAIKSAKAYGLENDHEVNLIMIPEHQLQLWKNALKSVLPDYMLPGEFVALDKMPLNSNGKVDRKSLPKPEHDFQQVNEGGMIEPRTSTEKMLAKIWSEQLNIDKISVNSNFFELGGHSLIAVKVMLAIGKETGKRLPITTLFENSTIEKLAKVIDPNPPNDDNNGGNGKDDPLPQGGAPLLIHVPTIDPQKEIWLACELGGDNASKAYNLSFSQYFHGDFNPDAMHSAVQELVNRHESLRSTFHEHGAEIRISKPQIANWHYYDLSPKSETEQNQFIDDLSLHNRNTAFNLSESQLFKAFLIKLSDKLHYFTISTHHIIFDGWSYGVAMHELGILYSAINSNESPKLDEPALFSEYALQKQASYSSLEYKDIEKYWLDKFHGDLPIMELPLDFPRPKSRTYESDRITYTINSSLTAQIKKVAVSVNTSIAITLRAALEVLLYRLTGQEDIITGMPIAGQMLEVNDNLIGHCVNMLPLRSALDGNTNFSTYLNRRKDEILDAYGHQDITFGHLLELLNTGRDRSRPPLISVVMNTALWLDEGSTFSGVRNELVENKKSFENFELILDIVEYVDKMTIRWDYNKALFTPETIYQFHQRFTGLLSQITTNPDILLDEISLMVSNDLPIEKHLPLKKINHPPLSLLINNAAQKYSTNLALFYENQTVSYHQLHQRSNQLANYFIDRGVEPGDFIALSLDRTPDMVSVLLAIIKSGAAYIPIDIKFPKERTTQILLNANPKLLIIQKNKIDNYGDFSEILFIEDLIEVSKTYSNTNPTLVIPANNSIYILHTSGSTGKPKGVCMANDALVNLLQWQFKNSTADTSSKTLQFSPLTFDVSFQEIFSTLLTGGSLSLIPDDVRLDSRSLLEHLKVVGINRIFLPFVALQALTESAEAIGTYPETLKEVMTAGEQLKITPQIVTFFKYLNGAVLFNQYGPTETHVVTQLVLDGNPESWPDLPVIGKPIDNTEIFILNKQLKEEPAGIVGELCIAGTCLAKGYINLPELTSEKFITLEQNGSPSIRLYRTGDLARYHPDGNIEYLGREDNQVKIRGFRIELGEIEAYLNKEPDVKQSVVTVQKDQSGNARLIANLTVNDIDSLNLELIEKWKQNLRKNLPDYMIPFEFVLLQSFPLTATGKIDRKTIPKVIHFSNQQAKIQKIPKTAEEIMLTEIWLSALGVEEISIDSDFFEIGGHSLIAVKVMVAIENKTGKRLPLASLFDNPTIEKLAKLINSDESEIKWDSLVTIKKTGTKAPIYMIHGGGLNVLVFNPLGRYMDKDQPVYAMQALGLNGKTDLLYSMEELADRYNEEIIKNDPIGPYALAGYSFGGLLAFEMAKRLIAMGKEIKMLGILDTYAGGKDLKEGIAKKVYKKIIRQFKKIGFFSKLLINSPRETINYQLLVLKRLKDNLFGVKVTAYDEVFLYDDEIYRSYETAWSNYHMESFDIHVDVFKTKKRIYFLDDMDYLGWREYAKKGVSVYEVPGDHKTFLFHPHDKEFAEILQKVLDSKP